MDYETARQFADTWGLVALFVGFIGIIAFVFRPGSKRQYDKDANIPLKED